MSQWRDLTAEEKVNKAKIKIQRNYPFYNRLTLHLALMETDQIPTAGVDFRGNLFYNPDFVNGLTEAEAKGLILHEALHLILEGRERRRGRKHHMLWNIAQDAIINHIVMNEGHENDSAGGSNYEEIEVPKEIPVGDSGETADPVIPNDDGSIEVGGDGQSGGAYIEDLNEESFESVYDILKREIDNQDTIEVVVMDEHFEDEDGDEEDEGEGSGQGEGDEEGEDEGEGSGQGEGEGQEQEEDGSGGSGGKKKIKVKGPNGNEKEIEVDEGDLKNKEEVDAGELLEKAVQDAMEDSQGSLPGGMEGRVDEVKNGEKNWNKRLASVIGSQIQSDYTWTHPHKKSHAAGAYLPDTEGEKVEVLVGIDTSGSISDENLQEFLGETVEIIESFDRVDLTVMQHDAAVQKIDEWDRATKRDLLGEEGFTISGRGGTDHRPVFKEIDDNYQYDPEVVILFTDGYTTAPDREPQTIDRVLWVVNNYDVGMDRLNFGEIVRAHTE